MREVFDKYVKKQLVLFYNKQNPDFHDYLHEFYDVAKLLLGEVYCIKADIASSERLLKFFGLLLHAHHGLRGLRGDGGKR